MICDLKTHIDIREVARKAGALPAIIDFDGERIVTTWTRTNFGGQRQWFLCPSCDRRCAIIYPRGNGPLWCCRICGNGCYLSEHMSPKDRKLHKAFKLRERLGQQKGGIIAPFPPKPKGMHTKTYDRLRENALKTEREYLLEDMASFLGVSVQEVLIRLTVAGDDAANR